ncbi:MAG TPA: hypothetical protein VI776_00675 [Anaerolineales bacterium]|nr:hypothetical protein [Anaerolineales bacterium]
MGFETFCATLLALLFAAVVAFAGYRFFLFLLPVWGFFFGFMLGAQTLQALFGTGFLADVTSWVFGLVVGLVFAVLSYLFYIVAVAVIAGSLGYALGVGLMGAIGFDFGLISWLVGIVLAVVVAGATILLNIQKWVIIAATAILGSAALVGTMMFGLGVYSQLQVLVQNPVRVALQNSPWWTLLFLGLAIAGFLVQYRTSRAYVLDPSTSYTYS